MNEESEINFFYEDCEEFTLSDPKVVTSWVSEIILNHNFSLSCLNFIFCSDEYLHKINLNYLKHDNFTDIITFDNSEKEAQIEGDIYISVVRVNENAALHKTTFVNELHRVLAHGALHLLGYNDKSVEEEKEMRKKEEACLSLYPN